MVLAFRGSAGPGLNMEASNDWSNDALGATGTSRQQAQAIAFALALQAKYPGAESLELTGHSLGGRLASLASLATGNNAVTFDPAGVSTESIIRALNHGDNLSVGDRAGVASESILNRIPIVSHLIQQTRDKMIADALAPVRSRHIRAPRILCLLGRRSIFLRHTSGMFQMQLATRYISTMTAK